MDRLHSVGGSRRRNGSRRRVAVAIATIATAAFAIGLAGTYPAHGATVNRAAVVVEVNGVIHSAKISFSTDSMSGLDALRAAGFAPSVRVFGGNGGAVCALDVGGTTIGCPSDTTCLTCSPASDYWAYWRALAGATSYTYSLAGAGSTVVHDGGVEAWNWSTGSAPAPFVSFQDVWGSDPTTTRPPASTTPTTRPSTPTTRSTVGTLGSIAPTTSSATGAHASTTTATAAASTTVAPRHGSSTTSAVTPTSERAADSSGSKKLATAPVVAHRGGGSSWGLVGFALILVLLVAAIVFARRRRTLRA